MMLGLESCELLTAHVGATSRHHDSRIPAQKRKRASKGVQAMKLLLELLVRRGGHDGRGLGERRLVYQRGGQLPPLVRDIFFLIRRLESNTAIDRSCAEPGARVF